MKTLQRLVVLGAVFSFLTLGFLVWPSFSTAKEGHGGKGAMGTTVAEPSGERGGNSTNRGGGTATNAIVAGQGILYAPRDVVDMTRLVLETTRDQTSHLAHYIERATTIILVFFSVLGAAGAVFGIKKVDDIEKKAATLTASFESAVALSKERVGTLEKEHEARITEAGTKLKEQVDLTEVNLHLEINDQMELLSARLEIERTITVQPPVELANRALTNAVKRIDRVLDANRVAEQARVRGLADKGYAKKRLLDYVGAYDALSKSVQLATRIGEDHALALLNYNTACYASLCEKHSEALLHLSEAIRLDGHYRKLAPDDQDLVAIRDDPKFKELLK